MTITLPGFELDRFVRETLAEDLGDGLPGGGRDVTSESVIPAEARFAGAMDTRDAIHVAGLPIAAAFFRALDPDMDIEILVEEGAQVPADTDLMRLEGNARAMLTAERSALNTVQHLSGIATMVADYVAAMDNIGANSSDEDRNVTRENHTGAASNPWDPSYRDLSDVARTGLNANIRLRTQTTYRPFWAPTTSDERYLQGSLHMFMAHRGIIIDNQKPEISLYILVDVLGTNRSRSNYILYSKDRLEASCELTYYAINLKGEIVLPAARSGARAQYSESSVLLVSGLGRKREQTDMLDSVMATPAKPVIEAAAETETSKETAE